MTKFRALVGMVVFSAMLLSATAWGKANDPPPSGNSTPTTSNLSASVVTLGLQSAYAGPGYFTLLPGVSAACGTQAQVMAGHNGSGGSAARFGSLPLVADTAGKYTVSNLSAGTDYTVCFVTGTFMDAVVTANFKTLVAADLTAKPWSKLGKAIDGESFNSLAFAPDGTPYLATFAGDSGVTVSRYKGSAWELVGSLGTEGLNAMSVSLAFAPDGTPYVALAKFNVTVMKFSGTAWTKVGTIDGIPGALPVSLAFGPDGIPYVAFSSGMTSIPKVISYRDSTWSSLGATKTQTMADPGTASLVFSPGGNPYFAIDNTYTSVQSFDLSATVPAAQFVGPEKINAKGAMAMSLAFGPDGTLYLAYHNSDRKVNVMKLVGSTWSAVGSTVPSSSETDFWALAIAPDGTPYVGFNDATDPPKMKVTVVKYNGSSWVAVSGALFEDSMTYPSFAFAPDGTPHFAFSDRDHKTTVMKLAVPSATAPDAATVAADSITATGATLNGTVNDNGADAAVSFAYGASDKYGTSVAATTSATVTAGSGSTAAAVTLTGLSCNSTYHFQVSGVNSVDTTNGGDLSFTTSACSPDAPTIGVATPDNAKASVAFTAPTSDGGATISGYTVTSTPGSYTGTGKTSPIVVTGLTNGTPYTFTVTATNSGGTSLASSASTAVTPVTVPDAPTSVSGVRGNTKVTVSFTAPAFNGGTAITGYKVASDPAGGVDSSAGTTLLSHEVTGLTNGTAYTFKVTATNAVGDGTPSTSSVAVTPATFPGAPTIGSATGGNAKTSVSFTAPVSNGGATITSYKVTANPGGKSGTGATSPVSVTGLDNGSYYNFTVTASNDVGEGKASSISNRVLAASAPGVPTSVSATGGNGQATLSFSAPAANGGTVVTGYTVTSNPSGGVDSSAGKTGLSHVVTGLKNGTSYSFTVSAGNAVGNGSASAASNSVTPAGAPGAPTGVSAVRGDTVATVSFSAPAATGGSTITGYKVTSNPAGGVDAGAGSLTFSHRVAGLVNGKAYTFTVTASNAVGTGSASAASLSVTPAAVPGAPSVVSANGGNALATVVFSAPTAKGGVAITGYTVASNPAGGVDSSAGKTTLSHLVTGLANGIGYTFTVTAASSAGAGTASAASNSVTPATVPGAPIFVSAIRGDAQAAVFFTPPASNGGAAITGYTVTTIPAGGVDLNAGATLLGHTVIGLANGTAYTFTIKASNPVGTGSASVASSSITPAGVPGAPSSVSATKGNAQATVVFSAPTSTGGAAITGYTVSSLPAGGIDGSAGKTTLSHVVTGLVNGTPYTFTVKAANSVGSGVASSASNPVTPVTIPGAPTGASATSGDTQATVIFSAPAATGGTDITGYTVSSIPAGGVDSQAGTTALSHLITGLVNGTAYSFKVTAANSVGAGSASAASSSITPASVPGTPTIRTVTAGYGQVTVAFNAPTFNGGSAITSYTVTASPGGATAFGGTSPIVVEGLTNGTAYRFTVTATNAAGTGWPSGRSSIAVPSWTFWNP